MSKIISHLFKVLVLVTIFGTLGVSIAILVTTLNVQNNQKNAPVQPTTNNQPNSNIYQPVQITNSTTGTTKYSAYLDFVNVLKQGLNTAVNPCDDFYGYVCGNFNSPLSFDVSDNFNAVNMATQMKDNNYVSNAPLPVKNVVQYFNLCVNARNNWDKMVADDKGKQVMNVINSIFQGEEGVNSTIKQLPFTMLYQDKTITAFGDSLANGFMLGYPIGAYGVNTLVTMYTDTNWDDPTKGYRLLLDQPSTYRRNTYYIKAWNSTQTALISEVIATMNLLASTQNIKLNQTQLASDAMDIINFDYLLATTFSTDDTTRRQFSRSNKLFTIKDLQAKYPNINWHVFLPEGLLQSMDAQMVVLGVPNYQVQVMEVEKLQLLNDALVANNKYNIKPATVYNYIYYANVRANSDYLPWPTNQLHIRPQLSLSARKPSKKSGIIPETRRYKRIQLDDLTEAELDCASETVDTLQYANARVFIDRIYPTADIRANTRAHVAKVANSILIGFQSMIDQLNWMTPTTKTGAYSKISHLVKNMAYPDWITDDAQLTAYHSTLGFTDKDSYFDVVQKSTNLQNYWQFELLNATTYNRLDFLGPPGTTNAWYQPELNSITFPAGILHQPFYDYNWPAAVNFGAMGVISGHELTHGFDDQGVQWDGIGKLNSWMDGNSSTSFQQMAQCVIDEYSGFCPLDKNTYGASACVDGAQTQGENIADNGGIHSAFRAYKNYISFNGPDPVLPDPLMSEFTSDQLFFMSFAQVWCQSTPSDATEQRQILVDVHSPSLYRVLGTVQNFPAFKDAFHCPTSKYAPDNHCNVWVSDISSAYGLPQNN